MVQQGDQRGDRRLAARRKSAARVLDTTRFHRAPAALGETRWQRISTDLSVFPYITAVERNAALTATALRGSASRYNKGPLLPAPSHGPHRGHARSRSGALACAGPPPSAEACCARKKKLGGKFAPSGRCALCSASDQVDLLRRRLEEKQRKYAHRTGQRMFLPAVTWGFSLRCSSSRRTSTQAKKYEEQEEDNADNENHGGHNVDC